MKIHIVQKGDTLGKLAQYYGVDYEELKSVNDHLSNPDLIMPGMKIKIPSQSIPVRQETGYEFVNEERKEQAPPKEQVKGVKEEPAPPMPEPAPAPAPAPAPEAPPAPHFHQQQQQVAQNQKMNMNFNVYKQPKMPAPPKKPKPEPKMKKPKAPQKMMKPKPVKHKPAPVHCFDAYPVSPVLPGCAPSAGYPMNYGYPMMGAQPYPMQDAHQYHWNQANWNNNDNNNNDHQMPWMNMNDEDAEHVPSPMMPMQAEQQTPEYGDVTQHQHPNGHMAPGMHPGYQQPAHQGMHPGYQQPAHQGMHPGYQQPAHQGMHPGFQQPGYPVMPQPGMPMYGYPQQQMMPGYEMRYDWEEEEIAAQHPSEGEEETE
ncbi:SafA/ExsA family spore coat assembly protein [Texcoconibacillus texcoconensis]|uniref:Morphogenetic protein associated with SpoVID n=1 Tax=Texcoconibacillus texcoconensis TaxID=1095777 RepID=A0A840QPE7_9BACI|nr:morphogenetic protein associated with SpoVID [Texcoconibacillus texcoconensis]